MANFRITDEAGGFKVEISTIDESIPNFVYYTVATGLSHTELHTLQFSLDFVDGDNNDVLWVKADNTGCSTFSAAGSWEQYHQFYAGNPTPITFTADSILFRLSGTAQPSLLGGGLLFDTFDLSSSTVPAMLPPGVPVVSSAPTASATAQHVDVAHASVVTNACQPVTQYTATLTPSGGGSPIVLTSPTPDFDFDAVPPNTYSVTVSATNSAGTSAESAAATVTVAPLAPSPSPSPSVSASPSVSPTATPVASTDPSASASPSDGGDGELAATGPTVLAARARGVGLRIAGFVVRRRAER